jgi:hypothetical protein
LRSRFCIQKHQHSLSLVTAHCTVSHITFHVGMLNPHLWWGQPMLLFICVNSSLCLILYRLCKIIQKIDTFSRNNSTTSRVTKGRGELLFNVHSHSYFLAKLPHGCSMIRPNLPTSLRLSQLWHFSGHSKLKL